MKVWISLLAAIGLAKLQAPKIADLKDAPLVTFSHDFPNQKSGKTMFVDQKQVVRINMTNSSPLTKTVYRISAYFADPDNSTKVLHQLPAERVQIVVKKMKRAYLKYKFIPVMEPKNVSLVVVVDYYDSDEPAYKSVGVLDTLELKYGDSPFDLQSITVYVFIAAVIAGSIYLLVTPKQVEEGTKSKKKVKSSAPPQKLEQPVEADMSWIPEHHLKGNDNASKPIKRTNKKKK